MFTTFGDQHLITLASIVGFIFFNLLIAKKLSPQYLDIYKKVIALLMFITMISWHIVHILDGSWNLQTSLPFEMCSFSQVLAILLLLTNSPLIFEFLFFWGIAGAGHALASPSVYEVFPDFEFIYYFVSHSFTFFVPILYLFIMKYRITARNLHRVIGISVVIFVMIGFIDYLLNANYFYFMEKPPGENILNYLPTWPWYVFLLALIGIAHFYLLYAPFWLLERIQKRKKY